MKRLLCIVGSMNSGGAETFLMKIFRSIDRSKYQMDFCVLSKEKGFYDDEIRSLGGKIFHAYPKSKYFFKSFFSIKKIVKSNHYLRVLRISQHSLSSLDLLAAKLGGAKVLAFRSSNSSTGGNKFNLVLHYLFRFLANIIPNVKIAPSTEAAYFMFGKKNKHVIILHNGIPVSEFQFNNDIRVSNRKKLNIQNKFVVGHIGRLTYQKNHDFLIDVFNEIKKKHNDSVLLLIGIGELEETLKNKVNDLTLTDSVQFLGLRSDISDLLNAIDVIIFPSFFEGMPNTIIEAQASGLHCLVSDKITGEANITGLVDYLSLNKTSETWASKALEYNRPYERNNIKNIVIDKRYDIDDVSNEFINRLFY